MPIYRTSRRTISPARTGLLANAPLALRVTDIAAYPVLQGQKVDPGDTTMLASPCRGYLPEAAFAKPQAEK